MSGVKMALSSVTGELKDDGHGSALVNLPPVEVQAGFATMTSEVDNGLVTLTRLMRSPETTSDFRFRVTGEVHLLDMSFEGAILRTAQYTQATSGMTIVQAGGRLVLNNAGGTASTNRAQIQTQRNFEVFGAQNLYCEIKLSELNFDATGAISEWGFGYPGGGVTPPTDGVFLRRASGGALQLVVNYAGSETITQVDLSTVESLDGVGAYAPAKQNHLLLVIGMDGVEVWCNQRCAAQVKLPSAQPIPFSSTTQPFFARVYVPTGSTSSQARRLEIGYLTITTDTNQCLSESTLALMLGRGAYHTQDGVAVAQTSNNANSAAPATATLSNTAAGYATLGGQYRFAAVAGAETDYALFAFQVPLGTNALPGRSLRLTNIRIGEVVNEVVAVATAPTVLQWTIACGASAVSLATADGSATTSPKRKSLGSQAFAIADPVGAIKPGFDSDLEMVVHPGCFVHVIVKIPQGAATATETFRGTVGIEGHYI